MKKIIGINRKASKNKRYKRRIGYREFISSIEARKALVKSMNLMDDTFFAAVLATTTTKSNVNSKAAETEFRTESTRSI